MCYLKTTGQKHACLYSCKCITQKESKYGNENLNSEIAAKKDNFSHLCVLDICPPGDG